MRHALQDTWCSAWAPAATAVVRYTLIAAIELLCNPLSLSPAAATSWEPTERTRGWRNMRMRLSTTLKQKDVKRTWHRKRPLRKPVQRPNKPLPKERLCRTSTKWRDPDLNRGHHDFQS
jgi:hypothetical protein